MRFLGVILASVMLSNAAAAQDASQRPVARPTVEIVTRADTDLTQIRPIARSSKSITPRAIAIVRPSLRPYLRPDLERGANTKARRRAEQNLFAFSPLAPAVSLIPNQRPARIEKIASDLQASIQKGAVCGDVDIQGEIVGRVSGRGQCGIAEGVKVKSVAGVRLSPAATIDCQTASALKTWVQNGLLPATNGQATSLRVVSHYSCRFRNSAASGKLSEHSFGRAIDIAGIGLADGREMTVLNGWNSSRDSNPLREMWRAACGPFGTVLGPNANRFHRDHFHFDTARYRSGSYCR